MARPPRGLTGLIPIVGAILCLRIPQPGGSENRRKTIPILERRGGTFLYEVSTARPLAEQSRTGTGSPIPVTHSDGSSSRGLNTTFLSMFSGEDNHPCDPGLAKS